MPRLSQKPWLLSLAVVGLACGPDDDAPVSASGITSVSASGTSGTDTDASTGADTTTTTGTTGLPTTGDGPTTGTTTGTTTDDPTGTTGPLCDLGDVNCACDQGACFDGLTCVDGLCVPGLVCEGDLEPDDDEASAHDLGEINDDDDNTVMAAGILSGEGDVDWYTYHGLDAFGHVGEPTVKVTSSAAVRVCQFLECDKGGAVMTEISCPEGTQTALSGALRPGCCGGATFTVSDYNCPGSSDDIQVYVRIDKPSQDECVEYSFVSHN